MGSGSKTIWAVGSDEFLDHLLQEQRRVTPNEKAIDTFDDQQNVCCALWVRFHGIRNDSMPDTIIIQTSSPVTWGNILDALSICSTSTKVVLFDDTKPGVARWLLQFLAGTPPESLEIITTDTEATPYQTVLQRM